MERDDNINWALIRRNYAVSKFNVASSFFYNIINHKQILKKYYNHQEHTYCYLESYKNTMLEQKLMEQITEIKILKEKRKIKQ